MKSLLKNYKSINRSQNPSQQQQAVDQQNDQTVDSTGKIDSTGDERLVKQTCDKYQEDTSVPFNGLYILFLIIDDFPLEVFWRLWLKVYSNQIKVNVKVLFHAKFPEKVRSVWVKEHLLSVSFRPRWGSIEITKAMIKLLEEALKADKSCSHFCFASESCLPCCTLEELIQDLTLFPQSRLYWKVKANNGYSQQLQFDKLKKHIPQDCIVKSDQWMLLSRNHSQVLVDYVNSIDTPFKLFSTVHASDEMFIATCFALLGLFKVENTIVAGDFLSVANSDGITYNSNSFVKKRFTFCSWDESNAKNPRTFSSIEIKELVKLCKQEGCLFMRKYRLSNSREEADSSFNEWGQLVYGDEFHTLKATEDWFNLVTLNQPLYDDIEGGRFSDNTRNSKNRNRSELDENTNQRKTRKL